MIDKDMLKSDIRAKMLLELKEKKIFNQIKDYAFDYADKAFERNVFPTKEALERLSVFDENFPEVSHSPKDVLELLHKYGSPATVTEIGGRYFGFVIGGIIPTALAAKWLVDFWDQNSVLYVTSPITSKLESIVEKWLLQIFNLPKNSVAGIVSGTSQAILCGLAAARYRIFNRLDWDINSKGFVGAPKIRVVAGKHAHSTILKMVALLGLGKDNIEWVDTDLQGRIIPDNIPQLDESTILILQAGNVNSGSFDDFDKICEKAKEANAWIHIDGAFGLWATGSEKLKHLTKGIEKANSWSVDGHKTLNTPYDSGIVLCNDSEALISALQNVGSYIVLSDDRDGMLYTPEMSRRARAVELWASLKYLGRKGLVLQMLSQIGRLPRDIKPQAGQLANKVKNEISSSFEELKQNFSRSQQGKQKELIDVTLPGIPINVGKTHVITQTLNELLEIFGRMGFDIAYGPEVEDEWHNFIALNIPPEHPAREPSDNFYIDDKTLLRSQTSTIQIRVMEHKKPPIRVVAPGRVYRPDTVDATHMYMFHQLEALVVDEGVSMVDMKTTIEQFIHTFFGPETHWRFRPSFFPFTEPSAEVDLLLLDKSGNESWVEMGGCGMVDPNVFDAVGIDSEKYTGWAFGFGIERLAMRKYGITDIRLLFENDLRFLRQF